MRFFVRSIAVAALALGGLACSDSPTQPSGLGAELQGLWRYDAPPNNNPGGGTASWSLDLTTQGTAVSGTATRQWLGPTIFAVTGTLQAGRVELDGTGMAAGVTPVAIHYRGVVLGGDLLIGNMTLVDEGMSYPFALTFRKSP